MGKYYDKLVDMLARIGDVLPRFRIFEALLSSHKRLVQVLSQSYLSILTFTVEAKAIFRGKTACNDFCLICEFANELN